MPNIIFEKRDSSISVYTKFYLLLFVLLPIINQYMIGSLTALQVYSLLSVVLWLVFDKNHKVSVRILFYILYVIVISIIGFLIVYQGNVGRLVLRLASFSCLILNFYVVFPHYSLKDFIIKWYTRFVEIITIILFVQYIIYLFSGRSFMLLLPHVTLNYNNGVNSSEYMSYVIGRISTGYYYRPCSIFIEPVFHSLYCIPYVVIRLFSTSNLKYKNIVSALFVTLAMVLTTSSMAIFVCFVIWLMFVVRISSMNNWGAVKSLLLVLPIVIIGIVLVLSSSGVLTSFSIKMNSIQNITESSSFTWRVLRGWECYKGIGPFQKIFGCGYGDVANYLNYIKLRTIYDDNLTLIDYMSGAFYMLCSIGVIGTSLMFSIIFPYLKKIRTDSTIRMLLICLLLAFFSSAIFDSDKFFLYLGLIVCCSHADSIQDLNTDVSKV